MFFSMSRTDESITYLRDNRENWTQNGGKDVILISLPPCVFKHTESPRKTQKFIEKMVGYVKYV